jgi:hypothetical protein
MINIICLKAGTKYNPIYVNNLYNMVKRNLGVQHEFICFTDDTTGINPGVQIRLLPDNKNITGWWWKPYMFKRNHFEPGDINLFIDLDTVIVNNIDKLLEYLPGSFVGMRDAGRSLGRPDKLQSAIMRWPAGAYSNIWEEIDRNPLAMREFPGDQEYIWSRHMKDIKFYPDSWIRSYKWEVRNRSEIIRIGGRFNFRDVRNVELEPETAVLAFHGTPDPHEVMDPVIVDNWR